MNITVNSMLDKLRGLINIGRNKTERMLTTLLVLIRVIWKRIRHGPEYNSIGLEPLYPRIQPEEHQIYLDALEDALRDDDIRNIALTGSYGSGKSSILKAFASKRPDRAIWISFSTLGANIEKYSNDDAREDDQNKLENKANLIQKEIVKQILYHEKYSNVPASRYPKIHRVTFGNTLFWALFITFILPALFFGLGDLKISTLIASQSATMLSVVFLLSFTAMHTLLSLLSKVQLQKLSGGPVSIALSTSNNYFDQYLDEIIYFFEETKYNVVILEDIDRFDDLYIFENLRQLNNLLNNSKQIGKRIRFIYAVKDSIFHEEKESDGNRTKFFDQIIPTVPFITHKNSRDAISDMFGQTYGLSKGVADIASKHVTDMRLLKNIYNEFIIFHRKIIVEGKITGLVVDNLFAMVVYKNIYLNDFEHIRTNKSVLDNVYRASRDYVQSRYRGLAQEVTELKEQINSFSDINDRSLLYGLKLAANINKQLDDVSGYLISYAVSNVTYDRSDQMQTKDFWTNITNLDKDGQIKVSYKAKNGGYGTLGLDVPKSTIKAIIDADVDIEIWKEEDVKPLKNQLIKAENEMELVRGRSIRQLINDYAVFDKTVRDITRDDKLIYDLLASGYIDVNYGLYTSIYREGSVSAAGMNFIVRNLQQNNTDFTYKFTSDKDIQSMLNELDGIYVESRSIYNFDIVHFLLRTKDARVSKIVRMMSEGSTEDIAFIDAYIENGEGVDLLLIELSKNWRGIFTYIARSGSLSRAQKNTYFGILFMNADVDIDYETDTTLVAYLEERVSEIGVIDSSSRQMTARIIKLLKHFRVEIIHTDKIKNAGMIEAIEANNLYVISAKNVGSLTANKDLSLSKIKKANKHIYERMAAHLDQYVAMIEEDDATSHSVDNSEDFVEVLNLSKAASTDVLNIFIELASDDCFVDNMADVEPGIWPLLFSNFRVHNTFPNVMDYYIQQGHKIDQPLVEYLNTVEDVVNNESIEDQAQKKSFAVSMLDSDIKTAVKANIVEDLGLDEHLKPNEFKGQNGELYGLLVKADVIEDSATTYNALVNMAWSTKEQFIVKSPKFEEYMSDVKFSAEDINGISASNIVGADVKNYLVASAAIHKDLFSTSAAMNFAWHAIRTGLAIEPTNLKVLLNGPDDDTCIRLIHASLVNLSRDDLLDLLSLVGGEYLKLGQPNKHPKLANTPHDTAIVQRLAALGVVSSFDIKNDQIKVNIKSSW